jgi:hypothetical protein
MKTGCNDCSREGAQLLMVAFFELPYKREDIEDKILKYKLGGIFQPATSKKHLQVFWKKYRVRLKYLYLSAVIMKAVQAGLLKGDLDSPGLWQEALPGMSIRSMR